MSNIKLKYTRLLIFFFVIIFLKSSYPQNLNLSIVGECEIDGLVSQISIKDNHAYITTLSGIQIINISNPQHPILEGSFYMNIFSGVRDCAIYNHYALLLENSDGLQVIDISDSFNPQKVASWKDDINRYYLNVKVYGHYAFLTGTKGLLILDINDPLNITKVYNFDGIFWSNDVTVYKDYAYILDRDSGIVIVDISNISNPQIISRYNPQNCGEFNNIYINDGFAYVTYWCEGKDRMMILDVQNPLDILLLNQVILKSSTNCIKIEGDFAYLALGAYSGISIYDIHDKNNISEVAYYRESIYDLESSNGLIYIPVRSFGLKIMRNDLLIEYNSGTTIIVHGLSPSSNYNLESAQNWTLTMAEAIANRFRGGEIFILADGNIDKIKTIGDGSEKIIILNWLEMSQKPVFGFAEATGDVLASLLVKGALEGLWSLDKLHFIAHSRGTIVSSEAIQRLGHFTKSNIKSPNIEIDNNIHFTTLDAHPWDDRFFDHIGDPLSAEDQDVNGKHINLGVACWENIRYADNYGHTTAGFDITDLNGLLSFPYFINHSLTENDGKFMGMSHGGVHAWYHGTIATTALSDNAFGGPIPIDGNTWYPDNIRFEKGYNYIKPNIQTTGSVPLSDDETYKAPSVFNGDFQKGYSMIDEIINWNDIKSFIVIFSGLNPIAIDVIPGWSYHGGSGKGHLGKYDNITLNPHLELDWDNNSLKHNYFFIPRNADKIFFKYRITNASFNDKLLVFLGDNLVNEIKLNWRSFYEWEEIEIPEELRGTSQTIEFKINGSGIVTSEVWIDDIGFTEKKSLIASILSLIPLINKQTKYLPIDFYEARNLNAEIHAYDKHNNHTGLINDSMWVTDIPESQYLFYIDSLGHQRQTIILPQSLDENEYRIEILNKRETNELSLQFDNDFSDTSSLSTIFENVKLLPQGNASINISSVFENMKLDLDIDGNGIVDSVQSFSYLRTNYLITSSSEGNGSIFPEGSTTIASGEDISFIIIPDSGYITHSIYVDSKAVSLDSIYSFLDISNNHSIHVVFSKTTGLKEEDLIRYQYNLAQNFPNPFNPITTIKFSIPQSAKVTIKIYDLLGKELVTLIDEMKPAGNYNIEFNGSNLSSGVYFYKMQSGDFSNTKKFILIK